MWKVKTKPVYFYAFVAWHFLQRHCVFRLSIRLVRSFRTDIVDRYYDRDIIALNNFDKADREYSLAGDDDD